MDRVASRSARRDQARGWAAVRELLPLLIPGGEALTKAQADLLNNDAWAPAACRHGLGPTFRVFLKDRPGWERVPPEAQALLGQVYDLNLARFMAREAVLTEVLQHLDAIGRVPILLKGLAFAHALYPDPAARVMGDIDLMVDLTAKEEVDECLRAAGFERLADGARPATACRSRVRSAFRACFRGRRAAAESGPRPDEGETVYLTRLAGEDILIEVHYHLINLRAGGGKAEVFHSHEPPPSRHHLKNLPAGRVGVLQPQEAFIHALRHLALHHRLIGLRWHLDLALMLVRWRDQLKADEIHARCQALNSEKLLRVELGLLRDLFGPNLYAASPADGLRPQSLPWEYPLYRHVARGDQRTPWRELVRTLLAPGWREQLQTLS